jgi:hypothetical protein
LQSLDIAWEVEKLRMVYFVWLEIHLDFVMVEAERH